VPRVPPLGGSHHWGRVAPPIAALSGSPPKAPGSAGGYLLIVASHDTITLTDLALASYEQALEPKRLVLIPGGHFDPYREQFPVAEAAATEWFCEHLVGPDDNNA
jgi:hypothetical protein